MKKYITILFAAWYMVLLAACGTPEVISGEVVTCGGNPCFFEVACENGENYGFVVSESTELIWEDARDLVWDVQEGDVWNVFGCGMSVTVIPGEPAESADEYVDACVEGWYYAEKITVTGIGEEYFAVDDKPVIYLYPESTMDVDVYLDYNGILTCTYPAYAGGWHVTAQPDGTLTDERGMAYSYLYREGITPARYDFSRGFCVPGRDTAAFLEDALAQLGLTREEANEFIIYWLPLMEGNTYNLIAFQSDAYTQNALLKVDPQPDTVLRVFMAWKPLDEAVEIEPQILVHTERVGFTLVEWGGSQVK